MAGMGTIRHPTAVAMSAVFLCPPMEADEVKTSVQDVLHSATSYDQASAFATARPSIPPLPLPDGGSEKSSSRSSHHARRVNEWGPPRFFIPHRVGVVGSAKPLLPSEVLIKIVGHKLYTPIMVLLVSIALGCMVSGSLGFFGQSFYWPSQYLSSGIMLAVFTLHLCSYSRAIAKMLISSFEFWYLISQVAAGTAGISYWMYQHRGRDPYFIALQSTSYLTSGSCLFLMDASRSTRKQKGAIMLLSSIGLALYAYLWNQDETETAKATVEIPYIMSAHIKTIISTSLATSAFFAGKYSFASLFLKHDAMMLKFAPRSVRLDRVEVVEQKQEEEEEEEEEVVVSPQRNPTDVSFSAPNDGSSPSGFRGGNTDDTPSNNSSTSGSLLRNHATNTAKTINARPVVSTTPTKKGFLGRDGSDSSPTTLEEVKRMPEMGISGELAEGQEAQEMARNQRSRLNSSFTSTTGGGASPAVDVTSSSVAFRYHDPKQDSSPAGSPLGSDKKRRPKSTLNISRHYNAKRSTGLDDTTNSGPKPAMYEDV